MFNRKDDKLDVIKINNSVSLLNKILKIGYILIALALIYVVTVLLEKWKILAFIKIILQIISPFFIGLVIAWLFHPIVSYLKEKKINRIFGTSIVYVVFIGLIYWLIATIIPVLFGQINDLVSMIPQVIENITNFITSLFNGLSSNNTLNVDTIMKNITDSILVFGKNITTTLPEKAITILSSFFSGVGTIFVGLIVGFYLLINFDRVDEILLSFIPKKARHDVKLIGMKVNEALNSYVRGTIFVSTIIFVTNYIGFLVIGVKSPLLFALFCGITNIIPYIGPYIGGIPVSLVALSQGPTIGLLTIIYIVGIQSLEGMVLQPIVMSKAMKLHPVTVIISLLIFGYFFGIIGMILATPIAAIIKIIFNYFDDKYDLLKYKD